MEEIVSEAEELLSFLVPPQTLLLNFHYFRMKCALKFRNFPQFDRARAEAEKLFRVRGGRAIRRFSRGQARELDFFRAKLEVLQVKSLVAQGRTREALSLASGLLERGSQETSVFRRTQRVNLLRIVIGLLEKPEFRGEGHLSLGGLRTLRDFYAESGSFSHPRLVALTLNARDAGVVHRVCLASMLRSLLARLEPRDYLFIRYQHGRENVFAPFGRDLSNLEERLSQTLRKMIGSSKQSPLTRSLPLCFLEAAALAESQVPGSRRNFFISISEDNDAAREVRLNDVRRLESDPLAKPELITSVMILADKPKKFAAERGNRFVKACLRRVALDIAKVENSQAFFDTFFSVFL